MNSIGQCGCNGAMPYGDFCRFAEASFPFFGWTYQSHYATAVALCSDHYLVKTVTTHERFQKLDEYSEVVFDVTRDVSDVTTINKFSGYAGVVHTEDISTPAGAWEVDTGSATTNTITDYEASWTGTASSGGFTYNYWLDEEEHLTTVHSYSDFTDLVDALRLELADIDVEVETAINGAFLAKTLGYNSDGTIGTVKWIATSGSYTWNEYRTNVLAIYEGVGAFYYDGVSPGSMSRFCYPSTSSLPDYPTAWYLGASQWTLGGLICYTERKMLSPLSTSTDYHIEDCEVTVCTEYTSMEGSHGCTAFNSGTSVRLYMEPTENTIQWLWTGDCEEVSPGRVCSLTL